MTRQVQLVPHCATTHLHHLCHATALLPLTITLADSVENGVQMQEQASNTVERLICLRKKAFHLLTEGI